MNLKQLESKLTELTQSERYHRAHPNRLSSRYSRIEKRQQMARSYIYSNLIPL